MAINRFDVYQPQGHVSQYVPLPFEELAAIGKQMQKDYESALTSLDDLPKLLKDSKGLKEVTGYGVEGDKRKLGTFYVGDQDMINAYNQELKNRLNTLSDDIMSGKLKGSEYKTEISKLKNQVLTDIAPTGKIGQATERYNTYQKNLEEQQKAKDLNKAEWLASPIYQNVGEFLSGKGDIKITGVGEYVDRNKELNDALSHIKSVGGAQDPTTDGQYIRSGNWEAVPEWKIRKAFEGWFENSASRRDIEDQITHKIMSGQIAPTKEAYNAEYNKAVNGLYDEAIGLYQSSKATKSMKADPNLRFAKEDQEFERALIGQPKEAIDLNLLEKDKKFQEFKKIGLFNQNADGSYSIDNNKLNETSKVEEGSVQGSGLLGGVPLPVYKTITSDTKKKELAQEMAKMAKIVGESDVSSKNYNNILNKYARLEKVRMFDAEMSSVRSDIETKKINEKLTGYDVMDPTDTDKPLGTITDLKEYQFEKGKDVLKLTTFEVTPSGKMNRVGYIKKASGEIIPITVRPKGETDNQYHSKIAKLSMSAAKYEAGFAKPKMIDKDGTPIVDVDYLPGVGKIEAYQATGSDRKTPKVVYLFTPSDPKKPKETYTNQGDMLNKLTSKYVLSDEGYSDRFYIAPSKSKFEGSGYEDSSED